MHQSLRHTFLSRVTHVEHVTSRSFSNRDVINLVVFQWCKEYNK